MYTAVYTAHKARPCLRPVHSSVHDRVHDRPCTGSVTAMKQADTWWQYSDSSEAYNVNLFKLFCINDNKRALQRLGNVSRPANVSSRTRLEIWTSRLGLVSAGEAKRVGLVSVSEG